MSQFWDGPQPLRREQRWAVVDNIVEEIRSRLGKRLIAVGLYGSMAKDADGPFSDIELFCAIDSSGEEYSPEWVYGPGKIEINFYSEDVLRHQAMEVEEDWAISQGQFLYARNLYGSDAFFDELRLLVFSPPQAAFDRAMQDILLYRLYEGLGKVRNAWSSGETAYLPALACHFAEDGALLLGLAHRYIYRSRMTQFKEALHLPTVPAGYAELCALVSEGRLSDPVRLAGAVERFWQGIGEWAEAQGIDLSGRMIGPFEEA